MAAPSLEVTPLRPAVRSDAPVTLDVLLKITPPKPEVLTARPVLNLGLVIDRSGSMGERNKITFAQEAAAFAVRELLPTDRVALTIFDNEVETIFPNAPVEEKAALLRLIEGITPRGSTALHGGWREGGQQVASRLTPGGLNRVLLLSDGLANVGESRPDAISNDVHRLAREGVSTTTLGLGDDYNEDLLEAMARSGDGNYYYVESPAQLPAIFGAELQGLTATTGTEVTLAVEPAPGINIADVLNDFDKNPDGTYKLPNLVAGSPIFVVVRLNVAAGAGGRAVCRFRLAWTPPKESARQSATVDLALPSVAGPVGDGLAASVEVQERATLLLVARYKKAATQAADRRDMESAKRWLAEARQALASAPQTPEIGREGEALARIEAYIERGQMAKFSKHAKYEAYQRRSSKPYP